MIDDYFKKTAVHCEGPCDLTSAAANRLYTVGSDDLIYCKDLLTKVESRMDLKAEAGSYTSISAHPKDQRILAVGGLNKEVEIIKFEDSQFQPVPVFKTLGPIRSVMFSKSGRYLAMATEEPTAILYNYQKKSFVRCRPGHSGSVCSVFFSPDERYVCSTGTDGILKVYRIEHDSECSSAASFEVTSANSMSDIQHLLGCFNTKSTMIAMPGRPSLQQVNIEPAKMYLTLNSTIKHSFDIVLCHWQNSEILITASSERELSLWKYHNGERILNLAGLLPTKVITVDDRFYCIDISGTLFEFFKISLIKSELDLLEALEGQEEGQTIKENEKLSEDVKGESEREEEQESYVEIKKPTKSKADKIVLCMPQPPINRSTSFFTNSRFLYISEFGTMIERIQGQSQSIEFQGFVGSAATEPKRKNLFTNRQLKYFALNEKTVVYADESTFGVISEDSWEMKLESIVGVAVGNDWVAVALEQAIKVFDCGGNQLRDIACDKKLVALAGYQNILAYVYHDTLPMWGCQSLRMHILSVDNATLGSFNCSAIVPLKLLSVLKTFGFSYEGMPYLEDSKGAVRVYSFSKAQWTTVYDPSDDAAESKNWLIGIRNYEMYFYKLEEDIEPIVAPRSQLIAVPLKVQTLNNSALYENKSGKRSYGQCLWSLHQIDHQRFRHEMWYKYTVSRDKTNPLQPLSSKIYSAEMLKTTEGSCEMDFMYLIKNMISNNEADKAYVTVKTFVRNLKTAEKLAQIFEEAGMRELAIKIETHFEQRVRQLEYEAIQAERLNDLQKQIHKALSLRPANPMQRAAQPSSQSSLPRTQNSMYTAVSKPVVLSDLLKGEEEKTDVSKVNPFAKVSGSLGDKIKKEFDSRIQKNVAAPTKSTKVEKKRAEQ